MPQKSKKPTKPKTTKATKKKPVKASKAKKVAKVSQPIQIQVVDNEPPAFKVRVRRPGYLRRRTFKLIRGFIRGLIYIWRAYIVVYGIVFYRLLLILGKWLYRLTKPWASKLLVQYRRIPLQTRRKLGILVISIIVVHIGYHAIFDRTTVAPPAKSTTSPTPSPKLSKGTPNYKTMLPAGKTIQQLGGWTRVSPPGHNAVYAYVDKLGGVQIDVSEQPLPSNFKDDIDSSVEQLAQGFNATDKIAAGGTTAYIGTSANGPQSVILAKNNLLILMKSTAPAPDTMWAAYITALQ